jgi:hypothetical protein
LNTPTTEGSEVAALAAHVSRSFASKSDLEALSQRLRAQEDVLRDVQATMGHTRDEIADIVRLLHRSHRYRGGQ